MEHQIDDNHVFGFWVYLMTDLVIFAVLFAAYAVLQGSTFGGPSGHDLFNMQNALIETLVLLTSSFTCGLASLEAARGNKGWTIGWLTATFALGASFLTLELTEFSHFVSMGDSWQRSAFLSSFFGLLGTHGLHIVVGLLWIIVAIIMVAMRGLTTPIRSKLARFALFWHFLDIVWIFIFTIVYLMGHTI